MRLVRNENGVKTYDDTTDSIFPWSKEWPKVLAEYNNRDDPQKSTLRKLKVVAPPSYEKKGRGILTVLHQEKDE